MVNESLSAFIQRRRLEIEEEEGPLRERLAYLHTEKAQINRAAIAAGIDDKPASGSEIRKRGPKPRNGTIKQAVVEILTANGQGLTAINLLADLNHRNGTTLLRSSLSPQLTRLKDEGFICLTQGHWHLPGQPAIKIKVSENEEPDPSLFAEVGSGSSKPVSEAHGVKAAPGGGG